MKIIYFISKNLLLLIVLAIFSSNASFSKSFKKLKPISFEENYLYHLSKDSNKKVLIFLHGGISNPIFKTKNNVPEIPFLIEENTDFVESLNKNEFDLIIPITNDSLNWLSNPEYCFNFIKLYLNSLEKKYQEIIISGFSDGGTGSYKIFYNHSDYFNGLVVFNGFPQHKYFNKNVDYSLIKNKKIIFSGTKNDNRLHYEFSLIEYCKQKIFNPNTYLYVTDGKHNFSSYKSSDFEEFFSILNGITNNIEKEPIHGYIKNDKLVEFYKYRKKIVRKYSYGKEYYKMNKKQKKSIKKKE